MTLEGIKVVLGVVVPILSLVAWLLERRKRKAEAKLNNALLTLQNVAMKTMAMRLDLLQQVAVNNAK